MLIVSTCKYKFSEEEFVRPIVEIVRNEGFRCEVISYREFKPKYDKMVICGTALKDTDYLNFVERFRDLRDFEGSVLGICAGYQILSKVFGCEIERDEKIGVYSFRVLKDNPLIGKGVWKGYFLHVYSLRRANKNLECLALQNDEICIFKVKNKDFYGVSFHPEVLNAEIIRNFLKF